MILQPRSRPDRPRSARGACNHQAGLSAEEQVLRRYARAGYRMRDRRWRGRGGEIDLVMSRGDLIVFVEVKRARSFEQGVARITPRQVARILSAGEEYLGALPGGSLTDARFDAAVVSGAGQVDIVPNAMMQG